MITRCTALALITAAGGLAAPAPAGDFCFCMCVTDIPDCVNGGGSVDECIDDWIAFPCDPDGGCCWDVIGPNLTLAANGVGGNPVVPIDPTNFNFIPFELTDGGGDPIPPSQVAYFYAEQHNAYTFPPAFYNPDSGHYEVEVLPGLYDPNEPLLIGLVIVMLDGNEVRGGAVGVAPCTGDLNLDGQRDSADLNLLLAAFGQGAGGDVDADGDTDSTDLNQLLSLFGQPCIDPV